MGVVQWAEKPLLKGTVSPSFERCAIAADSLEKKAGNKPTPPRAISISETELRAASQAKRLKHKQHQKPEPPLHKSKAKSFFSRGRVGLPRQCWPFTTVIRNMSCWCKRSAACRACFYPGEESFPGLEAFNWMLMSHSCWSPHTEASDWLLLFQHSQSPGLWWMI